MDHSTFTYLMAPGPGFLEFFTSDATPGGRGRIGVLLRRQALTARNAEEARRWDRVARSEDIGPDRTRS